MAVFVYLFNFEIMVHLLCSHYEASHRVEIKVHMCNTNTNTKVNHTMKFSLPSI